jgi:beta-mannosidase
MYAQSLSSAEQVGWTFRQRGKKEWMPASVPGGVHTDLLALGQIPDPFIADHELKVQWVGQKDWEYRASFDVPAEAAGMEHLFLVADGLDTLAEVSLNGEPLGEAENMFDTHRWEVSGLIKSGQNELTILFKSAVNYCLARNAEKPLTPKKNVTLEGSVFVRKAPCHFGWDWGPQLPPMGVWRDIRLEGYQVARIEDVHLRQQHVRRSANISARVQAQVWDEGDLTARLSVVSPNGKRVYEKEAPLEKGRADLSVLVRRPELWWPNGYGEQPLYHVTVSLCAGETVLETKTYQMGLRTLELRQEPDEWGLSFTFVVNGVPVFMKGSDWIPADSFPTRMTKERYEYLIRSAAESHQNMLRVWGGGYYEDERFYDLCDRYGILLWHDFMFACFIYPHDEAEFLENLHEEVIQNVRRLRHRACLALWCGNNEMEQGWVDWGWSNSSDPLRVIEREAYEKYFYHTLPEWVSGLDPDRSYWPSSASSNIPFESPNGMERGDMHYWDVWHGRKPFTAYRTQYPRFMSEFGFQSLPPIETIQTYAEPKDWNMTSYIMEHHQRSGSGNGLMIGQMTDSFRMPKDFPALSYLSMVLQAEGIRYGVEHWRRNKQRVSGTLYWQLNDCWPVASWSSIDYYGRWKALHYAAKRFYAPVLLSVEDEGTTMDVHVTSDLTNSWQGEVRWQLASLSGEVLEEGQVAVDVPALADCKVCGLDFQKQVFGPVDRSRDLVFVADLYQGDALLATCVSPFVPNKHLALAQPGLAVSVKRDGKRAAIQVTAESLARFVELKLVGADVIFTDNYFDVPARRTVTVSCLIPEDWSLTRVKKSLQVQTLYDSFAA